MKQLKRLVVSLFALAGVVVFTLAPAFTVWGIILTLALRRRTVPIIERKASDLPKTNVVPEMTARLKVHKVEYRDAAALKAAGTVKQDSQVVDGLNLQLVIQDEGEYFGRYIFEQVDFEGQYSSRSRQFLDAIEYPADENIDTDRIVDAEFTGVIGIMKESADGKYPEKNRIKKFMKLM